MKKAWSMWCGRVIKTEWKKNNEGNLTKSHDFLRGEMQLDKRGACDFWEETPVFLASPFSKLKILLQLNLVFIMKIEVLIESRKRNDKRKQKRKWIKYYVIRDKAIKLRKMNFKWKLFLIKKF